MSIIWYHAGVVNLLVVVVLPAILLISRHIVDFPTTLLLSAILLCFNYITVIFYMFISRHLTSLPILLPVFPPYCCFSRHIPVFPPFSYFQPSQCFSAMLLYLWKKVLCSLPIHSVCLSVYSIIIVYNIFSTYQISKESVIYFFCKVIFYINVFC